MPRQTTRGGQSPRRASGATPKTDRMPTAGDPPTNVAQYFRFPLTVPVPHVRIVGQSTSRRPCVLRLSREESVSKAPQANPHNALDLRVNRSPLRPMLLDLPPIMHKNEGAPEERAMSRSFCRPKHLGQTFDHCPRDKHRVRAGTKLEERVGVLALLDGKGRQHKAQMTAPSNFDRECLFRQSNEAVKVFPEIFEIPSSSNLGVHTAAILIRHYDQIHSAPRKITHPARDGNVAQTRNGGCGLKQVARPALGTREFRFLQFVHIPNDITGALAAHSCCLCRPPLRLGRIQAQRLAHPNLLFLFHSQILDFLIRRVLIGRVTSDPDPSPFFRNSGFLVSSLFRYTGAELGFFLFTLGC